MKLKVLVIQNNAIINNKTANFKNIESMLSKYKDTKFDLIVFPEVFAIGWDCSKFIQNAENIEDSETIRFLQNIALSHRALVIGGTFIQESKDGSFKNSCPIIDKTGKLIATYDKIHLFSHKDSKEDAYVDSGNSLLVLNLGVTKIGISICYDIRFPEVHRFYSQKGVEVLINIAAWSNSKPMHWDIMHKARAIENQCYLIVANQTGKISNKDENLGHSMVIDPWGEAIEELGKDENCIACTINLSTLRELRENFPLLRDRKDSDFYKFNYKEIKIETKNQVYY